MISAPASEADLRARLARLAGRTLGEIAREAGVPVPAQLGVRTKGFVGTLLERALGATAASRAEPDFPQLGIELKTLPVDARGRPVESTFVATLDLAALELRFERSAVAHKLARVAWVPVEAHGPPSARRCGTALLWSPSPEEREVLQRDYESIVELIDEGFYERVTARHGEALQLRPKGANAAARRWARGAEGEPVRLAPRAFYLRASFTAQLLARNFALPLVC